jgi:hypothetical protein
MIWIRDFIAVNINIYGEYEKYKTLFDNFYHRNHLPWGRNRLQTQKTGRPQSSPTGFSKELGNRDTTYSATFMTPFMIAQ